MREAAAGNQWYKFYYLPEKGNFNLWYCEEQDGLPSHEEKLYEELGIDEYDEESMTEFLAEYYHTPQIYGHVRVNGNYATIETLDQNGADFGQEVELGPRVIQNINYYNPTLVTDWGYGEVWNAHVE